MLANNGQLLLDSSDYCSSIKGESQKNSNDELECFASSICSADEKMFND